MWVRVHLSDFALQHSEFLRQHKWIRCMRKGTRGREMPRPKKRHLMPESYRVLAFDPGQVRDAKADLANAMQQVQSIATYGLAISVHFDIFEKCIDRSA